MNAGLAHCLREAQRANILIAIFGHRCGYRPPIEHLKELAHEPTGEFKVIDLLSFID